MQLTEISETEIYEIRDGVRRAKAASVCGKEAIAAQIGGIGTIINVPLKNLRSPEKDEINTAGIDGLRWHRVLRGTQAGAIIPPIVIEPGVRGKKIEEVSIPQDEFDIFR